MKLCLLLIVAVFASEENETAKENSESNRLENSAPNEILVKIEEDEYIKAKNPNFIGVCYHKRKGVWEANRWSRIEKKLVHNGTYTDEETAAYASDTLARKLMKNGEKHHRFNFPDDGSEVYVNKNTSGFFGVSYISRDSTWRAQRWSKNEKKMVFNGHYKEEETAAHASDTLARKLIANGEKGHEVNFPGNDIEVYVHKSNKNTSSYYGVIYRERDSTWCAQRCTNYKKFYNGFYKDEKTAAHASDTLARIFIANGEKGHKLNFPDDETEVYSKNQNKKRKRPIDFLKKFN